MFPFRKKEELPEKQPVKTADKDQIVLKQEVLNHFASQVSDLPNATSIALTEDQKLDLVSKIALYWKSTHIISYFKQAYNLDLNDWIIASYKSRKEWTLVIDRMRSKYLAGILEVAIANKRWRIEQYQEIYDTLKEAGEHSNAAKILTMVASELEEKKGVTNNLYMTQVNFTDEELVQERLKNINDLEAIRRRKQLSKGEVKNETVEL